jgi:hypothetical protein
MRRDTVVAHPVQGSFNLTGTIFGSLPTLLGQHRVQLAELTTWIVHVVVHAFVAQPVESVIEILGSLFLEKQGPMEAC